MVGFLGTPPISVKIIKICCLIQILSNMIYYYVICIVGIDKSPSLSKKPRSNSILHGLK